MRPTDREALLATHLRATGQTTSTPGFADTSSREQIVNVALVVGLDLLVTHGHARTSTPAMASVRLNFTPSSGYADSGVVRQLSPDGTSGAGPTVVAEVWWRGCRVARLDHPFDHPDDPTGAVSIRLDRRAIQREQARSVWIRPDRHRAPGYGSGGWGFESLVARALWFHRCHREARAPGGVRDGSGGVRSHSDAWVGWMVWSTTASRSV